MIKRLEDWPWSSYQAMAGDAAKPEWLTTDRILSLFGKQRIIAIAAYKTGAYSQRKTGKYYQCTQQRLGLFFARARILDSGPDTFLRVLEEEQWRRPTITTKQQATFGGPELRRQTGFWIPES